MISIFIFLYKEECCLFLYFVLKLFQVLKINKANVCFEFKVIYGFTRSVESSTDNEETTQHLILKNVQSIGRGLPYLNNLT